MAPLVGTLQDVDLASYRVVCLPDLFLDHTVHLPEHEGVLDRIEQARQRGGGNVLGVDQSIQPGGNAANTAHALARLGVQVDLIASSGPVGRALAEATLAPDGVGVDHVRPDGELSTTTILEMGASKANVMLNDAASLARFGPEDLTGSDRELIGEADAVVVANWANLREHGTELVATVIELATEAGTLSYLDTADPTDRLEDTAELLTELSRSPGPDVWAMNEPELARWSGFDELAIAGPRLAERTGAIIDVHASHRARSWGPRDLGQAPAFRIEPLRTTGAGDVFNAGNLIGHLLGLEAEHRLTLAHATAAAYLRAPDERPGSLDTVIDLLEERVPR